MNAPFTVIEVEFYPPVRVSKNYKMILDLGPNQLVAIGYRGTNIPNITTDQGVARLLKVEIGRSMFDRPGAISEALGIKEAMSPMVLTL